MMWRKLLIVVLVFGFSMIFGAASAWADEEMVDEPLPPKDSLAGEESFTPTPCEQADLEGVWTGRAARSNTNFRRHRCWDRFKIKVSSDGKIVKGIYDPCDGERTEVTRGKLKMSPRCIIRGNLATADGDLYVVRNGGIRKDRLELIVGEVDHGEGF